jgi:hypothetical protein
LFAASPFVFALFISFLKSLLGKDKGNRLYSLGDDGDVWVSKVIGALKLVPFLPSPSTGERREKGKFFTCNYFLNVDNKTGGDQLDIL